MPKSTVDPAKTPLPSDMPVPTPPAEKVWNPPSSQEEFDRIIGERLARERGKYADYADLKEKAAKFDEAQEAAKSEAEKQAEALAAAQAELDAYRKQDQVREWTAEVAEETGVSVGALRGDTKESILEHAEYLKAQGFGQPAKPQPVPTIGLVPKATGNVSIGEQIAAAEKAGNTAMVAQLKALQLGQAATK